jgi:choline dehydrogenase-like flavoprotein
LLTGSTTSFHLQPVHIRQQILENWSQSYLPPLRVAHKSLSFIFKVFWTKLSPTLGQVLSFPRAPVHGKPGKGFDYSFLHFPPGNDPQVLETDVVVVGSGCGAGVCAKNLAEAGLRVLVVEKSYHFPPEHLPMSETDAGIHLFQNGGVEGSDDNSISVIAGNAWGGGGTVNWSASLQTQGFVRQEWADMGLPFFTSSEFQTSLDRVCDRMGVSAEHITHNKSNQVLLEGARKLGYNCKAVPQNTGGNRHYCGYCTLGCGAAEKQGPVVSFLPDAERAGALFIEGFTAKKVLFETKNGKRTATGIKGTWISRDLNGGVSGPLAERTTREVIINAKRVLVSCGTLQSPLLLLRSGLTNPQIGRNLHLHPANVLCAVWPEPTNPWEGSILTTVIDTFQDLDAHGHGAKLEATTMLPSWTLPLLPWKSGHSWKLLAAKFRFMTGYISLVRDRDTGRVFPDPVDGRCRIAYTPSPLDRKHALEGSIALAKCMYVAGAREIHTTTAGIPPFVHEDVPAGEPDPGINDPKFVAWLALIRKTGLPSPEASFASAHQMGTCRMGVSERTSVVDSEGKVWGVEGLYVSDASVFPSASGVNPMVTNMGISDWISRGIAKGLKREGARAEGARL